MRAPCHVGLKYRGKQFFYHGAVHSSRANTPICMPNIASIMKSEISRIARKEIRAETTALKTATARYRHDIASLRKRVQDLERQVKRSSRASPARETKRESDDAVEGKQLRFSAARFAAQRGKLGLSAAEFAKLLGVSSLSVYNWESGKVRPRQSQLQAIASLRNLGKREARARLEQLAESS